MNNSNNNPSPQVEPPPLESIKYSTDEGGDNTVLDITKQLQHVQLNESCHNQPPIENPPLYLFDKNHFDLNDTTTITKLSSSTTYSSLFINNPLGEGCQNKTTIYKWSLKIISVQSWLALGVTMTHIGEAHRFSFTPYDDHGGYLLSANGYVWNRQIEGTNKYEYIAGSNFASGDIMSFELNCGNRELIIYKNSVKVESIRDIKLPVYPSIMMHKQECVEFMGLTESQSTVQEQPVEFSYQNHHITVEGRALTKKTNDCYHTVFFNKNLLGDGNNFGLFKWKIKILSTTSWIGLGVVSKEIAQGRYHDLSPYDNHGGYMYSINGYGWSADYEGANKHRNCGASCVAGDVITLELNCALKELTLTRDGKNLITFKNVYLPVYPFIMMHGNESVEILSFQQEASYSYESYNNIPVEFKHNPDLIETVGCKIRKLTESGYSNVMINRELGIDQIIKRYKVKITTLSSWIGIGVIDKDNINGTMSWQSYSPYDENGSFFVSANGFVWDSNSLNDPKYELVEAVKFEEGDVIILEMNCLTKELTFYKNNIANKMATIENVSVPVFPFLMLYGKEELEFSDYLLEDNDNSSLLPSSHMLPSFKYLPSCIVVNGGTTVTKTTTGSYTTVFVNNIPLGMLNQDYVFKWQVRIVSLSWIGLGVTRREIADQSAMTCSPYDEHGSYFLSANGYIWNRQLADPYYSQVETSKYQKGDVLVFTLDCKHQTLHIVKDGTLIASIDNIRLPVYPSFVLYDAECVEFNWI